MYNAANGSGSGMQAQFSNDAKLARMPSIKERCEFAVKQAEEQLAMVKEARELLDRNPDLERLLDIMQQSHF